LKAVRLRLKDNYGQLRRAITGRQKSSPIVPLGLHSLFACLRAIHPSVVFFCHTFCKRQKRRLHSNRHHRAAPAPENKQLKAIIHNM